MPISTLKTENKDDLLHHIIQESNRDYASIEEAYTCMGRSLKNRTTLLTIPHSKKGFGSKRAARGKLHFENGKLLDVAVKYKTTQLYPNAMDPEDIAVAVCEDDFTVPGEKLADYSYALKRLLRPSSSCTQLVPQKTQRFGMASAHSPLRSFFRVTVQAA
jgi:hypothetical protein